MFRFPAVAVSCASCVLPFGVPKDLLYRAQRRFPGLPADFRVGCSTPFQAFRLTGVPQEGLAALASPEAILLPFISTGNPAAAVLPISANSDHDDFPKGHP